MPTAEQLRLYQYHLPNYQVLPMNLLPLNGKRNAPFKSEDPLPRTPIRFGNMRSQDFLKLLNGLKKVPFREARETIFSLLPVLVSRVCQTRSTTRRKFFNQLSEHHPDFGEEIFQLSLEYFHTVDLDSQRRMASSSRGDLVLLYEWLEAQDSLVR